MERTLAILSLVLFVLVASARTRGDISPSSEHPVGWRNDGSGKYPDTTPVLTWSRRVKTPLALLTSQSEKPAGASTPGGEALVRAQGAFEPAKWLVIGPLNVPSAEKSMEQDVGLDETTAAPNEGDKLGTLTWKSVHTGERGIDFIPLVGRTDHDSVGYLCTYIFSPQDLQCGIRMNGDHGKSRFWLNGKPGNGWELARQDFHKGWNRLLIKMEIWTKAPSSSIGIRFAVLPGPDVQYETHNIAWTTRMPGPGYGMPIVVGDRLYCTSEPNDVVCLNKISGKVLWMKSDALPYAVKNLEPADGPLGALQPKMTELEAMEASFVKSASEPLADEPSMERWKTESVKRRKLAQELSDDVKKINPKYGINLGWGGGNCGPTPCSDGKHIFAWHGETSVLSCFDLDGTRVYTRFAEGGFGGEHGINASPLLAGDRIVVLGGRQWLCFNKETGDVLWKQKYHHSCYGTPALATVGTDDVAIAPDGQIVRIADGKILQKAFGPYDGEIASTVREGNQFYLIARGGFCQATLPGAFTEGAEAPITFKLTPDELQDCETYPVGSPVVTDGLLYATHSGWSNHAPMLLVIDLKNQRVLYRHSLQMHPEIHYGPDGAGVAASVAMAGGKLFVMDNRGSTLVLEPGAQYKQIAINTIEDVSIASRQEITQSTPIFEGSRMYYRAEENFYCIGTP